MIDPAILWKFLAGLGLFIFSMRFLESSIRELSGRALRRVIKVCTTGKLRPILFGALASAVLQSSSTVSLMILAFVGAGLLKMQAAVAAIIGSNLGTTATSWIVAILGFQISIESFALPFIAIGGVLMLFASGRNKLILWSQLSISFGMLFLGLDYMKSSMESVTGDLKVDQLIGMSGFAYLAVGIILTALIQSSSATMAIVLTVLHSDLITFEAAAALAVGASVGTTITVVFGALGGGAEKKQVAASHVFFNLLTGLVVFIFLSPLIALISLAINIETNPVIALALFHTTFKVLGLILFFPFLDRYTALLSKIFKSNQEELTVFIDKVDPALSEIAVEAFEKEVSRLFLGVSLFAHRTFDRSAETPPDLKIEFLDLERLLPRGTSRLQCYERLKTLHGDILTFSLKLQSEQLSQESASTLAALVEVSRDSIYAAKLLKDVLHNIDEFRYSELEQAQEQSRLVQRTVLSVLKDQIRSVLRPSKIAPLNQRQEAIRIALDQARLSFEQSFHQALAAQQLSRRELSNLGNVHRVAIGALTSLLQALLLYGTILAGEGSLQEPAVQEPAPQM